MPMKRVLVTFEVDVELDLDWNPCLGFDENTDSYGRLGLLNEAMCRDGVVDARVRDWSLEDDE